MCTLDLRLLFSPGSFLPLQNVFIVMFPVVDSQITQQLQSRIFTFLSNCHFCSQHVSIASMVLANFINHYLTVKVNSKYMLISFLSPWSIEFKFLFWRSPILPNRMHSASCGSTNGILEYAVARNAKLWWMCVSVCVRVRALGMCVCAPVPVSSEKYAISGFWDCLRTKLLNSRVVYHKLPWIINTLQYILHQ